MLVYLAISLHRYGTFYKMPANSPQKLSASIRLRKHNRDMVLDAFVTFMLF